MNAACHPVAFLKRTANWARAWTHASARPGVTLPRHVPYSDARISPLYEPQTITLSSGADLTRATHVQQLYDDCQERFRTGVGRVRLDLRRTTRMDTKLVASLVALKRGASSDGRSLEIICSDPLRAWLTLCKLSTMFGDDSPGATPPSPSDLRVA